MAERTRAVGPPGWFLAIALAIPMAGLALLLVAPSVDVHWEHHPSHFWLVFGVALVNVGLGLIVSEVARRSGDERLFLVSMVLLTSAGFLALHALATPGVVLAGPNGGFVLATPIGLLLASAFAAGSSIEMDDRTDAALRRWQTPMRIGLVVLLLAWAVASVAEAPPLARVLESERAPWLLALLPFGVAAYVFAAWRYVGLFRLRAAAPAARGCSGLRVPRRGHGRDGLRPGLAGLVVGMARADGDRVRHHRGRRSKRVPHGSVDGWHLRGHLPGSHARTARSPAVGRDDRPRPGRSDRHDARGHADAP